MKKYSRHLLLLLTLLILISVFLSGCGGKIKNEQELQDDLANHPGFSMAETAQITEFSIIKRLTDEKTHTDTVYVSVGISHENVEIKRAYTLYYTKYNEGWLMDRMEEYYGDDATWEFTPKLPTGEDVISQLADYSNGQIDRWNAQPVYEGVQHENYFFEEGKYAARVYSGELISPTDYVCVVVAERAFDLVDVEETLTVYFVFDESTYEWVISGANIAKTFGRWNLPETWVHPESTASIFFDHREGHYGADAYEVYTVTYMGETFGEAELVLPLPTTEKIENPAVRLSENRLLSVTPNGVWLELDSSITEEVVCTSAEIAPTVLENIGITEVITAETAQSYADTAKEALLCIFANGDSIRLSELWHPAFNLEQLQHIISSYTIEGGEWVEIIPMMSLVYPEYEVRHEEDASYFLDELETLGHHPETICASQFLLGVDNGSGMSYDEYTVLLVKEGSDIYIIGIE